MFANNPMRPPADQSGRTNSRTLNGVNGQRGELGAIRTVNGDDEMFGEGSNANIPPSTRSDKQEGKEYMKRFWKSWLSKDDANVDNMDDSDQDSMFSLISDPSIADS